MDAYKGVYELSVHRFRELQPLLDELRREEFAEHKSPRFKVFLKHLDRDDWAVVVKAARSKDFVFVRGGLDFMFGPPSEPKGCLGCTRPSCNGCPSLKEYAQGGAFRSGQVRLR